MIYFNTNCNINADTTVVPAVPVTSSKQSENNHPISFSVFHKLTDSYPEVNGIDPDFDLRFEPYDSMYDESVDVDEDESNLVAEVKKYVL